MESYQVREPKRFEKPKKPFIRVAFAAAHVVADPLSTKEPWLEAAIDWDATIAYRRHLWSWGFGVAEAMDTAQRGMGLDWQNSLELIRRSIEAAGKGDLVASGAGTDHLSAEQHSIEKIIAAYEEQCAAIMGRVNREFSKVAGARAFAFSPPAIPGIGTSGGVTFILQDRAGKDVKFLADNVTKFVARLWKFGVMALPNCVIDGSPFAPLVRSPRI